MPFDDGKKPSTKTALLLLAKSGFNFSAPSPKKCILFLLRWCFKKSFSRNLLRTAVLQQLAALPPAERDQVLHSVTALRRAVEDIQGALGQDPGNALLQELLVNACQDEMTNLSDIRNSETKL